MFKDGHKAARASRREWLQDRAWQAEAGEEAFVAEPRHRRDPAF
jgi:hypothetical protein